MTTNCHSSAVMDQVAPTRGIPLVAVVGPANSGKSILFNHLTNSYSVVANYAQTTTRALRKKSSFAGRESLLIDTPGIASLSVTTDDERETRNILLSERPDSLVLCGDATALKRTLVLLAQVKELGIPMVMALNKVDEALKKGVLVDVGKLSIETGVPVCEIAAMRGAGLDKLENTAPQAPSTLSTGVIYSSRIEEMLAGLSSLFPDENRPCRGELLLLLAGDTEIKNSMEVRYGEDQARQFNAFLRKVWLKSSPANLRSAIFNARIAWAERIVEAVTASTTLNMAGFSHRAAAISRHPVFGWPVLIAILWLVFQGVGTVANQIAGVMDGWIAQPFTNAVSSLITMQFINELLVGNYGLLTMGVLNAIITVVPILTVFYLIINVLEDIGYLPNLSVLANRVFRLFGLTGKAVLPYTLGFGCNTMATLTSRMLETKKERIMISFLIALGVPCSAQLGVMLAIMATAPFSALLIVLTSVIATQIICGVALHRMIPSTKKSEFIIELPGFSLPNWKNTLRKTWFRLKDFLVEALPMFVMAAGLMFFLDKTGLLSGIKTLMHPVVTGFLSLPDKITEVFILVLSRREVGAVHFKDIYEAHQVDYYQTVVGLIVITLFIPCISNTMAMIKELGVRWAVGINTSIIAIAFLVGGLVNYLIRMI
ncbi:MAG: ferrous iron transport protein B [Nitrospirota bacterium]|nr:ferrous iron transport protein B [Nitrospirota bacterium]